MDDLQTGLKEMRSIAIKNLEASVDELRNAKTSIYIECSKFNAMSLALLLNDLMLISYKEYIDYIKIIRSVYEEKEHNHDV